MSCFLFIILTSDLTNCFYQKLRKRCPISYGKFQHDPPNGVALSSDKLMGVASPPALARTISAVLAPFCVVFPRHG